MATSAEFLDSLEKYIPSDEDLAEKLECPICMRSFVVEDRMHVLPCGHAFHPECCLPWLKSHNTCPVCRHELPSDDPQWEARKQRQREEADREKELEQLHDNMFG